MTIRTLDYAGAVPRELARSEAIQAARPDRHTPLRAIAQSLSRRGVAAAKVELVNAALQTLVELLFEVDDDGVTPHVDVDGRLLVPAPWGKAGYRVWGLRATEGKALRWLLHQRQTHGDALFVYDADGRAWLIGRGYTSKRVAMAYLRQCPVTLAEWRLAWSTTRSTWASRNLGEE